MLVVLLHCCAHHDVSGDHVTDNMKFMADICGPTISLYVNRRAFFRELNGLEEVISWTCYPSNCLVIAAFHDRHRGSNG